MNVGLVWEAMNGDYQAIIELNDIFEENGLERLKEIPLTLDSFEGLGVTVRVDNQKEFEKLLDVVETKLLPLYRFKNGWFHSTNLWTKKKKRPKFKSSGILITSSIIYGESTICVSTSTSFGEGVVSVSRFIHFVNSLGTTNENL